jgi:hypothetical protein
MVAAIHPLTPGSPAYAVLKISAVGGLIALRVVMSRRSKRNEQVAAEAAPTPVEEAPAPQPHPVSKRKRKRRRRRA